MIKTLIGFAIGVCVSIFALTYFETGNSRFSVQGFCQAFSANATDFSSNTINATPPPGFRHRSSPDEIQLHTEMFSAVALIKTRPLDDPSTEFINNLVSSLTKSEPGLTAYVRARQENQLTNREALEIFEMYYSLQSRRSGG